MTCTAQMTSFSPSTLAPTDMTTTITVTGQGLNYPTSVRTARFEIAVNCTLSELGTASSTVELAGATNYTNSAAYTTLTLHLPIPLSTPGTYSLCLDMAAGSPTGWYQNVPTSQMLIGFLCCFFCLFFLFIHVMQPMPRASIRNLCFNLLLRS